MPMNAHYALTEPIRDAVDVLSREHPLLVEFGASWCPICESAQPLLAQAFEGRHERVQHIKVEDGKGSFGFNAASEEYEDLVKAGIIDPTKVVRTALQDAASVAGLLITTEAMIADKPEKKAPAGGPPGGGMGDMGGMDF